MRFYRSSTFVILFTSFTSFANAQSHFDSFSAIRQAGRSSVHGRAAGLDRSGADFASGAGNILFLAAGVGLPLIEDGRAGRSHAVRVADALGVSLVFAEALKAAVREERPNEQGHDSFPSGHATAAFAVATVESALHPSQAPYWYLGATVIGLSRVRLHEHYVHDVIVGAAIGYGTARWELSRPRGLVLSPWIQPTDRSFGLQVSSRF